MSGAVTLTCEDDMIVKTLHVLKREREFHPQNVACIKREGRVPRTFMLRVFCRRDGASWGASL